MSVQQPSVVPLGQPSRRVRWLVLGGALVVGVAIGVALAVLHSSSASSASNSSIYDPGYTWPARQALAPAFTLRGKNGQPISLAQFRGRPVIVTFIDPLCRNLCPFEAKVLGQVVRDMPAAERPAIVAVSVNQWANARGNLVLDQHRWNLPSTWHWAVGSPAALARVWKDYAIGVTSATRTIAGVTVHRIAHTEASYILDASGYKRALFLYPFRAADVESALRSIAGA